MRRAGPILYQGVQGYSIQPFTQAWTYNPLNQLTEIDAVADAWGGPGMGLEGGGYYPAAPGNNGQITQADDGRTEYGVAYTYDALKRLTRAQSNGARSNAWSQTYGYDVYGNLTAKTPVAGSAEPAMPAIDTTTNRVAGVVTDANGNVTSYVGFTFAYVAENRMISATSGSLTVTYQYDPAGHLLWASDYTNNYWGPDGKVPWSQAGTLGAVQVPGGPKHYGYRIYFGNQFVGLAQSAPYPPLYSLTDRLGSGQATYPYGTDIGQGYADSMKDFATYKQDSFTFLKYANPRWHSAGFGRFMTADNCFRDATRNPDSWNKYS